MSRFIKSNDKIMTLPPQIELVDSDRKYREARLINDIFRSYRIPSKVAREQVGPLMKVLLTLAEAEESNNT